MENWMTLGGFLKILSDENREQLLSLMSGTKQNFVASKCLGFPKRRTNIRSRSTEKIRLKLVRNIPNRALSRYELQILFCTILSRLPNSQATVAEAGLFADVLKISEVSVVTHVCEPG
jgi:hypothetical protein